MEKLDGLLIFFLGFVFGVKKEVFGKENMAMLAARKIPIYTPAIKILIISIPSTLNTNLNPTKKYSSPTIHPTPTQIY